MKALIIGGTGVISTSVVRRLCDTGWDVTLLNRGVHAHPFGDAVRVLTADIADEARVAALLRDETFDAVCNFVVYTPDQALRDVRLFCGKTAQYIFISSASAYQKPVPRLPITEDVPLLNPYWQYSRDKAACEEALMREYRQSGFPVTIVRPSHTYSERSLPTQIHGANGAWAVIERMRQGKSVPVAADGETLWTLTAARDFAVYFCGLMGNRAAIGEAYHITSDESLTWNAIYGVYAELLGVEYKPCYVPAHVLARSRAYDFRGQLLGDKANSVIFDNSKVMCATGIASLRFTPFAAGARESLTYHLSHSEMQRPDPAFDAFCDHLEAAMRGLERAVE